MLSIRKVLMERDGLTAEEAEAAIWEAKEALTEYLEAGDLFSAEDICAEYFGLEPDYIVELL